MVSVYIFIGILVLGRPAISGQMNLNTQYCQYATAPNAFGHVGRRTEYLIDTFYHCDISEIDPDKHTPARPLAAESLEGHRSEGKLGIEQKKNLHLKWEYGLLMLNYFQHYLRARMIMPHKLPLEAANALAILIATFVLKS